MLGLLLGPLLERGFRQALFLGRGNLTIFFENGIENTLWGVLVIFFLAPFILRRLAGNEQEHAPVMMEAASVAASPPPAL